MCADLICVKSTQGNQGYNVKVKKNNKIIVMLKGISLL